MSLPPKLDPPTRTLLGPGPSPVSSRVLQALSLDAVLLGDVPVTLSGLLAPDGSYYYPAFPYTSYVGMTDRDVDDLFEYLQ